MTGNYLDSLLDRIDSPSFAARMSLANDLDSLLDLAWTEPCVQDLLAVERAVVVEIIRRRWLTLANQDIDCDFTHPLDRALAVYLWILEQKDLSAAVVLAEGVHSIPNTRWARWCAHKVLNENAFRESVFMGRGKESPLQDDDVRESIEPAISTGYRLQVKSIGDLARMEVSTVVMVLTPRVSGGKLLCGTSTRLNRCPTDRPVLVPRISPLMETTGNEYVQ